MATKSGVVRSGALDTEALRSANILVGNPENFAGLELTLRGPTLRFEADALLALTGADLAAAINGRPVPRGRPVAVRAGTTLAFGAGPVPGRAWLAVAGGVAVPPVLGSRSTYLRAALGGMGGRALRAGDVLPLGEWPAISQRLFAQLTPAELTGWAAAPWHAAPAPTPGRARTSCCERWPAPSTSSLPRPASGLFGQKLSPSPPRLTAWAVASVARR
ncbi:MAG: biotin-dependent carboxyltransferase family protein [Hymenobacter sp.]